MSDAETNSRSRVIKFSKAMIPTRDLIDMVRARRCLWDRACPEYRDRIEKDKAWYEIYKRFEPNFDTLGQARKNLIASTITRKWHNTRDSYVKSRKTKIRNRPYLYSDELRFLDESLSYRKRNQESLLVDAEDPGEQNESQTWINEVFVDIDEDVTDNGMPPSKREKAEYETTSNETPKEDNEENIVSVLINLIHKEEDEDRAFFKSITPAVKKLSDTSKFEFRIQVMKLINSLKLRDRKLVQFKSERTSHGESDSD